MCDVIVVREENDGRPRAARKGEDKDVPREMGPPVDDNACPGCGSYIVLLS